MSEKGNFGGVKCDLHIKVRNVEGFRIQVTSSSENESLKFTCLAALNKLPDLPVRDQTTQ